MNNKILRVLTVLAAILLGASIVACLLMIYRQMQSEDFSLAAFLCYGMGAVTAIFAEYYILAGCKKAEGAKYYTAYMTLFAITEFAAFLSPARQSLLSAGLIVLSFAALGVLAFAKDFGRKRSLLFSSAVVYLTVLRAIVWALSPKAAEYPVFLACSLVLSLSALWMVCAKYADKAERKGGRFDE